MFQNANEVVQQIEKRRKMTKGISYFRDYMNSLQNPHLSIPCIHVAGTNGKGSTVNYVSSILQALGYRVGTFTSPYLHVHFDRIRINGENIPEADFLSIANKHYDEWIAHDFNMFEIDMCIASLYFQSKDVDFVIYEVGLGGSKDATNIILPIVSVITNIGLDHTQLLGDSYEAIARQKAGIIKENTALITGEKRECCLHIIQETCKRKKGTCIQVREPFDIRVDDSCHFSYQHLYHLTLSTKAIYQVSNACCALEVIFYLAKAKGILLNDKAIYDGLLSAHWKGRFEVVNTKPEIIVDGAHNLEGIQALIQSLKRYKNPHIIFSALHDKNVIAMLEMLKGVSNQITVCSFEEQRSISYERIKGLVGIHYEENYKEAIDKAMDGDDVTVITGSLYFVSAVLAHIKNRNDDK